MQRSSDTKNGCVADYSSTSPDQIPVKFLKMVAEIIAGPITEIIKKLHKEIIYTIDLEKSRGKPYSRDRLP